MTIVVLGAGPTGISVAAGAAARREQVILLESQGRAGGLAASFPRQGYTFEPTGSQWLWDSHPQDPVRVLLAKETGGFNSTLSSGAVYLAAEELLIPLPLHGHLAAFGAIRAKRYSQEILDRVGLPHSDDESWRDHLTLRWGKELSQLFYHPYLDRHTGGLLDEIRPPTRTPAVDPELVLEGARRTDMPAQQHTLAYPAAPGSWGRAWGRIARQLDVRLETTALRIRPPDYRQGVFSVNAARLGFGANRLVSTMPLPELLNIMQIEVSASPELRSGLAVINIGGKGGNRLPKQGWLRIPDSRSGFHHVAINSNVNPAVAPPDRTNMAVLFGMPPGSTPDLNDLATLAVAELTSWGWLHATEVVESVYLPGAGLWRRVKDSGWLQEARAKAEARDVIFVGQHSTWQQRGMHHDSRDGLALGAALRGGQF